MNALNYVKDNWKMMLLAGIALAGAMAEGKNNDIKMEAKIDKKFEEYIKAHDVTT